MLNQSAERTNRKTGGAILVAVGTLALVGQVVQSEQLGLFIMPALAIIFLIAGMRTRSVGWIIPGGILSGIGAGALLVRVAEGATPESMGAVMLLSMAAGFLIITPLAAFIGSRTQWWALIVAGGLALVGGALFIGGAAMEVLKLASYVWPLGLIAMGAWIILRRR